MAGGPAEVTGAREPVVDLVRGRVRVERPGLLDVSASRVAVLAHWSERPTVTRSFRALVGALVAGGYRILVVSGATCDSPLGWRESDADGWPDVVRVLRKPNLGYDFGSWAVGLDSAPWVARAPYVVLANDSLVGPFAPIGHLIAAFEDSPADVWGLTETLQFTRHVQSFLVGYRRGVLDEPPLARFWRTVRHYRDKSQVIHRGELALGRLMEREGYAVDAACVAQSVVAAGDNPTITGWRALLDRGVPFVKREIVRTPELAPEGDKIGAEVRRRYGTDIREWWDT